MPSRSSLSARERSLRSQLHLLLNKADGFIHGSLIEMVRKCGSSQCRCASNDQFRHRSLYLGQTRKGKKSMVYLPNDLEPQVREAIEHFQQALTLLEELNAEARLRLDKRKHEGKTNKKRARKSVRKKASGKKASGKKAIPTKKPPKRS